MKVEYIKCDVCDKEIERDRSFRKFRHIIPIFNMDCPEHICDDCFLKFKQWVAKQKEAKNDRHSS